MAVNVAIQMYRGTLANLAALATTGKAGVLAWTTDSNQFFVDSGAGTPGYGAPGSGAAWIEVGSDISVFSGVASQSAMIALAAKVGDLALRTDTNLTYVLTAYPASTAGNWVPVAVTSGTTIQGLASGTPHEWVSYIDASGVQHLTQPAFSDISGQLAQTQLPATIGSGSSLTDIDCGSF
jgi:hypothetical protein